jgi:predicted protein tyrosine phosphatase
MQDIDNLTPKIFLLNAPYANVYQSNRKRWLFVCSAGMLRSPTGAAVATAMGINARSCGSNTAYALIPLSVNLIMWADKIFFVHEENYMDAKLTFEDVGYWEDIEAKCVLMDIPDIYEAYDPKLVQIFENELKAYL